MEILASELEVGMKVTNTNSGKTYKIGKLGEDMGRIVIYNTRGKEVSTTGKKVKFILH